jgi:hypothetical protein
MALKPLALDCHVNISNYLSELEVHNLGGRTVTRRVGKPEEWLILFGQSTSS